MYLIDCLLIADIGYIDENLDQKHTKAVIRFLIRDSVNTNGTILETYNKTGKCLNEFTVKSLNDLPSKLN